MLGRMRWLAIAKTLLTVGLAVLLVVNPVGGLDAIAARGKERPKQTEQVKPTRLAGKLTETPPPPVLQALSKELEKYQPQVTILSPKQNQVLQDTTVSVRFQVKDLPIFKNASLGLGPHLHVFLDNQPYQPVYDLSQPLVFEDLAPGTHSLRVFASRPWHESFKNDGAYAQATFHIFTKTGDNSPEPNLPLLTYSRPQASYGAEPILLDFYLTNAPLHLVAQENANDDIPDWRIRCTVNGESFILDRWQPIYLKGFKPGKNWVQLEYIDEKGNPVKNVFNNTVRLITYEPGGKDTLSKLVRGELSVDEAGGIVDLNYHPPAPAPTPSPEPEVIPFPSPSPAPSPEAIAPTPPSPEPTVSPELPVLRPTPAEVQSPEATPEIREQIEEIKEPEPEEPEAEPAKPADKRPSFLDRFRPTPRPVAPSPSPVPTLPVETPESVEMIPMPETSPAPEPEQSVAPLSEPEKPEAEPAKPADKRPSFLDRFRPAPRPVAPSPSPVTTVPVKPPESGEIIPTPEASPALEPEQAEGQPETEAAKPAQAEPSPSPLSSFRKFFDTSAGILRDRARQLTSKPAKPLASPTVEASPASEVDSGVDSGATLEATPEPQKPEEPQSEVQSNVQSETESEASPLTQAPEKLSPVKLYQQFQQRSKLPQSQPESPASEPSASSNRDSSPEASNSSLAPQPDLLPDRSQPPPPESEIIPIPPVRSTGTEVISPVLSGSSS